MLSERNLHMTATYISIVFNKYYINLTEQNILRSVPSPPGNAEKIAMKTRKSIVLRKLLLLSFRSDRPLRSPAMLIVS